MIAGYLLGVLSAVVACLVWRWANRPKQRIHPARGAALTAIGESFGLPRRWWEPDFVYRRRVMERVVRPWGRPW